MNRIQASIPLAFEQCFDGLLDIPRTWPTMKVHAACLILVTIDVLVVTYIPKAILLLSS
jgi:hypothetical protein